LLGPLREKVLQKKKAEESLQRQIIMLGYQGQELAKSMRAQEHYMQYLFERAQQWKDAFAVEQEQKHSKQQVVHEAMLFRRQRQAQAVETAYVVAQVMPRAFKESRIQLAQNFADEATGRAYVEQVLAYIKKSL
jgi:S-adenosylmethionine synthetase